MADDSDIPPLEDMTDILQKAELIREKRFGAQSQATAAQNGGSTDAKKRAKVTKKHVGVEEVESPVTKDTVTSNGEKENAVAKTPKSDSMFGGMKKGFLFGGSNKQSAHKVPSVGQTKPKTQTVKNSTTKPTEDIPFISPSGKTESGLTFNEVQQAMTETKGLLDNQEWITEDFLSKIEKNDTLLKRFSDPQFMSALQEFQTNPQAAMAKYKGNTEVEKFLMEFCGVLGDHFTNLGNTDQQTPAPNQQKPKNTVPATSLPTATPSNETPKIVEIGSGDEPSKGVTQVGAKVNSSQPSQTSGGANSDSHIRLRDPKNEADIKEIPQTDDEAVKHLLNDPKIMETLMDPKVMTLIKMLKDDPVGGQRFIDTADLDLKEKVRLLVAKGLLQFEMS